MLDSKCIKWLDNKPMGVQHKNTFVYAGLAIKQMVYAGFGIAKCIIKQVGLEHKNTS
jgi:hypothetical protein